MALGTAELLKRMRAFVVDEMVLFTAVADPKAVDLFVVGGHEVRILSACLKVPGCTPGRFHWLCFTKLGIE
jgi:hypothetical protein